MSALTLFKGDVPWYTDRLNNYVSGAVLGTAMLMDASTERIAFPGCIWHPTVRSGTINIRKVHFRLGAVTFNALSTMRVSLQNYSMTAGSPFQPDGTQDQTYDFVGTGLTANTWTTTGNLSADRAVDLSAVSPGDAGGRWVCVVFEYSTFTAGDSLIFSTLNANNLNHTETTHLGGNALIYNGATWGISVSQLPIVALECSDGTFAFLEGGFPISALGTDVVGSTSTIRAAGLKVRFPVEVKLSAMALMMVSQNGADGTLTLYDSDGTTALANVTIDNDAVNAQTTARMARAQVLDYTLAANTYYRIVFVATSVTTSTIYYVDVNAVGLMDGLIGGQDAHYTTRDSGGTWTDTTTRRPIWGAKIGAVHDGAAAGGSGIVKMAGDGGGFAA